MISREDIAAMDAEANAFAMELLLPEEWLRADVARMGGIDIEDEKRLKALAKKYRVSEPVMAIRLGQLMGLVADTSDGQAPPGTQSKQAEPS